jgi:hypothetical protein
MLEAMAEAYIVIGFGFGIWNFVILFQDNYRNKFATSFVPGVLWPLFFPVVISAGIRAVNLGIASKLAVKRKG